MDEARRAEAEAKAQLASTHLTVHAMREEVPDRCRRVARASKWGGRMNGACSGAQAKARSAEVEAQRREVESLAAQLEEMQE